ncbi:MAG: hypothetical protein ACTS77_01230, partial [Arsenophonus sp. NC-TX2-MAG3]
RKFNGELQKIWVAENCDATNKTLNVLLTRFSVYYPEMRVLKTINKELLEFYSFLSENWAHPIKARNLIVESSFYSEVMNLTHEDTVVQKTISSIALKLLHSTQKSWNQLMKF